MRESKLINLFFAIAFVISTILIVKVVVEYSSQNNEIVSTSVLGLSVAPKYIPNNYINLGDINTAIVLPDGNLWYTDPLNGRIVKISQSGEILRTVGRYGYEEGSFDSRVNSITKDNNGNLYVQTPDYTYKLDFNGGLINKWGGGGPADGQFNNAQWISYDSYSNTLLVSDKGNFRVQIFSTDGVYLNKFGTEGNGNGQFLDIQGITSDSQGRIYVVDSEPNCRVEVFSPAFEYLFQLGTCGTGDGQITVPRGLAIKPNGDIMVASTHGNEIQEFDSTGNWLRSWGVHGEAEGQIIAPFSISIDTEGNYFITDITERSIQKFDSNYTYLLGIRNSGITEGRLSAPEAVAYDSIGNMYIMDNYNDGARIQKFTNSGVYISTIVTPNEGGMMSNYMTIKNDEIYLTEYIGFRKFDLDGNLLLRIRDGGSGNGQFLGARGIAVDSLDNIYVGDTSNFRVQKFNPAGEFLLTWGTQGIGDGQFMAPYAEIVIDSTDNIYVADNQNIYESEVRGNTRIQVFNTNGEYIRTIGTFGDGDGQLVEIGSMAFDLEGNLHVTKPDIYTPNVQVFNPDGTFSYRYLMSAGSGVDQFLEPRGLAVNPLTGNMTIVDKSNHRVQLMPTGTRIFNLISSADVLSVSDKESLVNRYFDSLSPGVENVSSRLYFGDYVASDFNVDLTQDRDWSEVNTIVLPNDSKSLLVNVNPTTAPGVSSSHSIYVVKQAGQTYVHLCPDAVTMDDVTMDCANGYDLVYGVDGSLTIETIDGIEYWKISGLN